MRTEPVVLPVDIVAIIRETCDVIIPLPPTVKGKTAKPIRIARDLTIAALHHGKWPNAGICQWLHVSPKTIYTALADPTIVAEGLAVAQQCDERYKARLKKETD